VGQSGSDRECLFRTRGAIQRDQDMVKHAVAPFNFIIVCRSAIILLVFVLRRLRRRKTKI
jgi:hypothetical protein